MLAPRMPVRRIWDCDCWDGSISRYGSRRWGIFLDVILCLFLEPAAQVRRE